MWSSLRRTDGAGVLSAFVVPLTLAIAATPSPLVPSSAASNASNASNIDIPRALIPDPPDAVLEPLTSAVPPTSAGVEQRIQPLLDSAALGPAVAAEVADAVTGRSLLARDHQRAAVPASTAKILTAAALLSLRQGEERLATRVVRGAKPGEVVLVGGGDVLLAPDVGDPDSVIGRAGLGDLARATAKALGAQGRRGPVQVRLDDTLFAGPAANPRWGAGDINGGFVALVQAIEVDSGNATPGRRSLPGHPFARVADPAMSAGTTFAAALRRAGVNVAGSVTRAAAPTATTGASAEPRVLAEVHSATISELIEQALTDSDNTVAEALARLVAVNTNLPATFEGAGLAVLATLARQGFDVNGQSLGGGSGLGSGYRISPHLLVQVLARSAGPDAPHWRPVLTGLPVAGASGTLAERFDTAQTEGAGGMVRAKTGTLTGVSALAGTAVDVDGQLLVFAVLADQVAVTDAARASLDQVAAALASCGCS